MTEATAFRKELMCKFREFNEKDLVFPHFLRIRIQITMTLLNVLKTDRKA